MVDYKETSKTTKHIINKKEGYFYNILEKSLWCYQDYTVNQKYKINLQNVFPLLWTNYDPQQKTYHFKWQGAII